MVTPIKDTPILYGKDAIRFLKEIEKNKCKKISKEELARLKKNYDKIKSLMK